MHTDQLSRVLEPTPGEEEIHYDDLDSPLMTFPTSYILDRFREAELVDHAMMRLEDLENETGRNACSGGEWWKADGLSVPDPTGSNVPGETWMGKRLLYDKTFKNEVDWRPHLLGGIFKESNLVIPAARRICRQMIARAVNYFFGTSPWFAIYPVGEMDRDKADKADRYIRWKMDQAKLQRAEEQAVERAFIIGEGTLKTSWSTKEQIYKTLATVLVDENGKDILGADGDYIFESDEWITDTVMDEETLVVHDSGLFLLKRDGQTVKPELPTWQQKRISRKIVHYRGPEAKVIHFLDFLCPLEAESVQEADCVVHLYDMPLMNLADQWKKSISLNSSPEEKIEATRKAVAMLRMLASSGHTESGQNSDAVDKSTDGGMRDGRKAPVVEIAEFWLRYDADGDGILEEVMLVVDRKTRMPIFYDYAPNVTESGLRPFSVVRVNEVPGRWYGMGAMEMMNPSQQILDLWMNRKNKSVSGSGRVDFWNPQYTLEGRANPHLELNWGGAYTPINGKKGTEILESVYLQDAIGAELTSMIEFVMQIMMNESGVSNANDGNLAGMESTKLATGIRNIEKSGQELFGLFLGHLEPGIAESLDKMVKLVFANLDQMEVYRFFEEGEGGEGGQELRQIQPGDIANMEVDTRVLLSRHRGEQILESSGRVIELVKEFDSFSYERQVVVAPTFIAMAKALQAPDAKKLFTPVQIMPTIGGGMPDPSLLATAAAQKPRLSEPNL